MQEYQSNNAVYIDINDIRREFKNTYCRGIRSNTQLLERKNITDFIYGRIVDDKLVVTDKLSRKLGSTYINKAVLGELFEDKEEDKLPPAPPLIEDRDLVFFKDDQGREFNVPMRGERTKDGIFFQVKAVMHLFEMTSLHNDMKHANSGFKIDEHYKSFKMPEAGALQRNTNSEMYLTYVGLRRVIERCRSGIGHTFRNWIDEIVFSSLWGTKEQKVETFKKVLNADADHLKAIMSKSPTDISCLYLINVGMNEKGKQIMKYGFTNSVTRRFKEHVKHYGEQTTLELFILIPNLNLSKAEAEFKNSVSRYSFEKEGDQELICLCDEAIINVKNIFRTISDKHCGNMATQIAQYESEIKDLRHSYEMELHEKDMTIMKLSMTIELKDKEIEVMSKDNEILNLKLQLAQK